MPEFSDRAASVGEYLALREACGLGGYSENAARIGLEKGLYGVWLRDGGTLVGMGRLIGDGGLFAQVTDIAVHPGLQRQGWGDRIMTRLMEWAQAELPSGCYISLIADPGAERLYQKHGFEFRTGMARRLP